MTWRERYDTIVGGIAGGLGIGLGVLIVLLITLGVVKLVDLIGG